MRSFNDVSDHTIDMINAIISGNYIVAGNILSSYDISLTVKFDEKNTVEHILLSKDSDLINLLITKYEYWDFAESEISVSLIDTIYDYFCENLHQKVSLSVSSDSYRMFGVSKLNQLPNIKVDIPVPRSVTSSLDREYQTSELVPSSPSKWDKKSLLDYVEGLSTSSCLNDEAHSLMAADGEVIMSLGAQSNSLEMAAEEISASQINVGLAEFDSGEDDELIFAMEGYEEDQEANHGFGIP
jgi:hypothetical protein